MTHDELLARKLQRVFICFFKGHFYPKNCKTCWHCWLRREAIEEELAPLSKSQIRRITKVKSDELRDRMRS